MYEFTSYRGFMLFWTGWKDLPAQIELVGQWVAVPPPGKEAKYYSTTGGVDGELGCPGLTLDLSQLNDYPWIFIFSSESEKDAVKKETLNRIKRYIDKELENADIRVPV